MPDQNNPVDQNLNPSSLGSQSQGDDLPSQTSAPDETQIQSEINQVAGTASSGPTQITTPKPVVEETSGPPPPAPPSIDDEGTLPPSPLEPQEDKEGSSEEKESLPPPPGGDGDSEGSEPPGGIPPVVTSPKPKRKFGGKKMIATVLGILFLVGGIGAGVILVQNQQDIRERAAVVNNGGGGSGGQTPVPIPVPTPPQPTSTPSGGGGGGGGTSPTCREDCIDAGNTPAECNALPSCKKGLGEFCTANSQCQSGNCLETAGAAPGEGECAPTGATHTPAPTSGTGGGGAGQCGRVSLASSNTNSVSIQVTQTMINSCQNICTNTSSTPWIDVYVYECDGIGLSQGCQDNGSRKYSRVSPGTYSASEPTCGTVQIDAGCFNAYGAYGNIAFASKAASTACTTTSSTPPPSSQISCQCLNIQAFDTEWNKLSAADLATLQPGDTVRFSVAGQTNSGAIDMARFTINGTLRPAVTQKRPGTNEYYDEYTIPEGVTSFSIQAELHHTSPQIDWF